MAPRAGRRRGAVEENNTPTPPPPQTQRRHRQDDTPEVDEDDDMDDSQHENGSGGVQQLSKGLVRYVLSCEYARKPIKRQDINEKGEDMTRISSKSTHQYSTWLTHSPLQRRLLKRQCTAHGGLWHANGRALQSRQGDDATEAWYATPFNLS